MFRIKQLAESQGMNITQLASKAGMAYSIVFDLWHNKTRRPDMATLQQIANVLQVSVWQLHNDAPFCEKVNIVLLTINDQLKYTSTEDLLALLEPSKKSSGNVTIGFPTQAELDRWIAEKKEMIRDEIKSRERLAQVGGEKNSLIAPSDIIE